MALRAVVSLVLVASGGLFGVAVAGASAPVDVAPIALPDRLGDLNAIDLATSYPGGSAPNDEQLGRIRAAQDFNAAGFSAALGGVAAASRRYAPEALTPFYDVLASCRRSRRDSSSTRMRSGWRSPSRSWSSSTT